MKGETNKVVQHNNRKLAIVLLITLIISTIMINSNLVNIKLLIGNKDFLYNMISLAAVLGGFLFTGLSVLISLVGHERIGRLWENNYLDNLYYVVCLGMISSVITIICSISILIIIISETVKILITKLLVVSVFYDIMLFVWAILRLFNLVKKIKETSQSKK